MEWKNQSDNEGGSLGIRIKRCDFIRESFKKDNFSDKDKIIRISF